LPADSSTEAAGKRGRRASERALEFAKAHWHILIVVAIMVAAFLIRLHYLSKHTEYTADSYYFLILARSIRDTFTYTVRGIAHTKYLPGYPISIWLGGYVAGGLQRSANLIALLGATFTVLLTYGIGRELFNKWAGVVAALIVAFQPTFLKWTVLPMTEGLFTFLFAAGVYLLLTGFKRASLPRRTLGAVAGGLCFLVRWEGILFLPLMVLIAIIYFKGSEFKWWEALVMLFVFGLPMGIYVARNLIVTGKTTSYLGEFREYSMKVTYQVLKHRVKVLVWNGLSDSLFAVLFFIGALYCLVRKKWKAFLLVGGWYALFAGFHLFWYYSYERFMAPPVPAAP
jgi:4-amino-4-deoxy-L-arabinose transferase-like glycosyltransferase